MLTPGQSHGINDQQMTGYLSMLLCSTDVNTSKIALHTKFKQ